MNQDEIHAAVVSIGAAIIVVSGKISPLILETNFQFICCAWPAGHELVGQRTCS